MDDASEMEMGSDNAARTSTKGVKRPGQARYSMITKADLDVKRIDPFPGQARHEKNLTSR